LMSASRTIPLNDAEFILNQKEIDAQMVFLSAIESGMETQLREHQLEHQKIDARILKLEAIDSA
jgi:hypothetical protein